MTKSEYQELVEFLAKQFAEINGRFEKADGRFDSVEARLAQTQVTVEENRHLIQLLAEGQTSFREEMAREFASVRQEMREGFTIQGNLIRHQGERLDAIGGRVDRLETREL